MADTNNVDVMIIGDSSNGRAVSVAVSTGTLAGASLNNELIEEEFNDA